MPLRNLSPSQILLRPDLTKYFPANIIFAEFFFLAKKDAQNAQIYCRLIPLRSIQKNLAAQVLP